MEICQATGTAGMRKPCFVQHGREISCLHHVQRDGRPRTNHPAVHFSAGSRILSEIPLPRHNHPPAVQAVRRGTLRDLH